MSVNRARGKIKNNTRYFGFRCGFCENYLKGASKSFLKNKRHEIILKDSLVSKMKKIIDGEVDVNLASEFRDSAYAFSKTDPSYLSDAGKKLKRQLAAHISFCNKLTAKEKHTRLLVIL